MGTNRIESQVSEDLYHREMVGADNVLPFLKGDGKGAARATQLNHSNYTASSPAQKSPQPKGSIDYFPAHQRFSGGGTKPNLNFIEQLAGFELTPGETFILGGLVVLASPMIAVGMLAGCERDLIPKAPPREGPDEALCGGEKCELPNAISTCREEECRIAQCERGFVDLNGIDEDGCECNEAEEDCGTTPPENRPPILEAIGNKTINEGENLRFRVNATDEDGDLLQFSAADLPEGATFDSGNRTFRWTPTFEQAGVYPNIRFEVTDGELSASERITITVSDVNRAPTLDPIEDQVLEAGEFLEFTLSGSDPDRDNLAYSAVGLPAGATLDPRTGQFTWTPAMAQIGSYQILFEISDGDLTDSETINIEVRGVREVQGSRITNDAAHSSLPSLVWAGSEYGVSWEDPRDGGNREIYFARISEAGRKIGSDVRISTNAQYTSQFPSLIWRGREYGVSWFDARDGNYEIYFARIDASGNKIGGDVRITNDPAESGQPSLVWTGREYGVSWTHSYANNDEIYFVRFDASGNRIGSDVRITNAIWQSELSSLVWTGSEYGVSWQDSRDGNSEIYFARIDASGNKIGGDVRITNDPAESWEPSMVWTGSEYGVSWHDFRSGNLDIYFARLDRNGNKIGGDVRITNVAAESSHPSLVWTGGEYGLSWRDVRDGNVEIYFARIDASGNKIGGDVRITNDAAGSVYPSLVWTGSEYGVSWQDDRDGNWEIYFARIIGVFGGE